MRISSTSSNTRFFGIDLEALRRELRAAWHQMGSWRIVQWLTPTVPVRVFHADGREAFWMAEGEVIAVPASSRQEAQFSAVELPDDHLLLRKLTLPSLSPGELAQAVALDIAGASPFAAEDLAWGYSTRQGKPGTVEIQAALASRIQVLRYLHGAAPRLASAVNPEVWAMGGGWPPVVLHGFGEARRLSHVARRRKIAFGFLLLALGLALLIVATPVAQLRMRALEAAQKSNRLIERTEPLVRQRAVLGRMSETGESLKDILAQRSDPLYVMELLTKVLPDDTSLLGLQIQGSKVSINGMTVNAAALMQQLSARTELRDVKAPTAATRPLGAAKDSFSIEFTLAPISTGEQQRAVAPASQASAPAASAASAAKLPSPPGGASFGGSGVQPQKPARSAP